jgi:hypothetical protein
MKVVQTEYGTSKDILFNLDPYTARPIMVEDDGVVANENGRKIVPAGTILGIDGKAVNDAGSRYVLLKDVDVTNGPAAGAGVYRGTINKNKLPVVPTPPAMIALKGIIFMSDDDLEYV